MYNVNNKRCLNNLVFKSFKANRSRNIIAVIAIILTTLLFTASFTVAAVFFHSFEQSVFRQVGGYSHGSIKDVTYEDIERLAGHDLIESYGVSRGIAVITDGVFAKNPAEIKYVDKAYAKTAFVELIEGEMPSENSNEIICDTKVLQTLGLDPVIGSTITISYNVEDTVITEDFILSGYFEANNAISSQTSFIYTSRSYADSIVAQYPQAAERSFFGRIDMSLMLRDSNSIEGDLIQIIEDSGYQADSENSENFLDYGVNWSYLSTQVASSFDLATYLFAAIILLLFTLSGYLIIFNIFKISVTNDIRFYGLLKTIGTTGRQIRMLVYRQAIILSAIAIPIGLVLGFIIGSVIAPSIITRFSIDTVELTVNPYIFIVASLFSLITVFLSCQKPSKIASAVSPIEAVRYTEASVKASKNKKTNKASPFTMALANIKRSISKTAVVVLSLSLAVLILQFTVVYTNGFDMEKYLSKHSISDFVVGNTQYLNSNGFYDDLALGEDDITIIKSLDGVEEYGIVYGMILIAYAFYDYSVLEEDLSELHERGTSQEYIDAHRKRTESLGSNDEGQILNNISLYGLDSYSMGKINVFEGSVNDLQADEIVAIYTKDDYNIPYMDSNSFKIGDTVSVRIATQMGFYDLETDEFIENIEGYEGYFYEKPLEFIEKEYTVAALATIPHTMSYRVHYGGVEDFALPSSDLLNTTDGFLPMNIMLDVEDGKTEEITGFIQNYTTNVNSTLDFDSREKFAEEFNGLKNMFFMVGLLLSIVVGFIGALNFFNVIFTSITVRKREFAVLQSIGMTGKQLRRMLVFESLIYIALASLTVTLLSLITSPMLVSVIESALWFFSAGVTFMPIVIAIIIMVLVGVCVPLFLYKLVNKFSVIERLREF